MTQILRYLSAAAALALPLTGAAFAQSVELRYATSAPPKTVWEMQVVRFQKQVEDGSKGSLKINAFLNSQLGSEQDTVQQVARGRIDSGGYSIDRRLAAGAGDLAAQHPLPVQGPEGAGLRLRQSPDQADPGHVPQEGRGDAGLERGGRRRHHRQEALSLSRRAQGPQGALGTEQGRSLHVEPVRRQSQSAPRDGVELGLPDRPHRRRRTRRRPSTSSPACPSSPLS